ncbi:ChaN family lipoprotein [Anderseniella sp. Alg231-50]|uniref:ChaN family lipoprotein n=1 Tax=Anderseniella sp. Alg231-50 TaxID=1922226 RepID=UPI00307C2CDE
MTALLGVLISTSGALADTVWQSPHFRDHQLVGKIYASPTRQQLTLNDVKQRAARARFVLLGEIHTNPDHHRLQAEILQHMVDQDRRPAVVIEMISRAQQPVLDFFAANPTDNADDIAARLEWSKSGWPDFAMYKPIFEIALKNRLTLRAGNLEKSTIRRLGGRVGSKLTGEERAQLGLNRALDEETGKSLLKEIARSHCNMMPETVLPLMVDIQRARDHVMASALMDATNKDGAVLIAGAGHTRLDWGVGSLLEADEPGSLLSLAFREVFEGATEADFGKPAHHVAVVTPRSEIKDHCAVFRKNKKKT